MPRLDPIFAVLLGLACARPALADEHAPEPERTLIAGLGGAGELELGGGAAQLGGNLMLEWEAIDEWLELEADVSLLGHSGRYELPVDVLFKKPFRLSDRFECMIGLGPEIVRVAGTSSATHYGVEAAFDLMYWQTHRFGAWVEPAYDLTFGGGTSQSLGITAGAMIGW